MTAKGTNEILAANMARLFMKDSGLGFPASAQP